ncbi:MAG: SOS response-associated peptidase family protein [Bradyrhizobium sp.]|nr:SOS response-associated peptidase family protein [Bradyrhizobium sp.]
MHEDVGFLATDSNICPITPIDTVVSHDGKRELTPMRWALIPNWWSKPLKEMKLATFNARAERSPRSR